MRVCKADLITAVCPSQLCAGLNAGCEAAFHSVKHLFDDPDTQGILFIDASNAFNNLNRSVTLHNLPKVCPILAPILTNTYRVPSDLFVGGRCLLSSEGTTQGDPLAMAMYAIGTLPLINRLKSESVTQIWYADDSAAGGELTALKQWWKQLNEWGPRFGYFPNSHKTSLLVKPDYLDEAISIFQETGIQISSEGGVYLGAPLGSTNYINQMVGNKIAQWKNDLVRLSEMALSFPHESFSLFTRGILSKWTYFFRTIDFSQESITSYLSDLEYTLCSIFLPALTNKHPPGTELRELLSLPTNLGGLGIPIPKEMGDQHYTSSIRTCAPLVDIILTPESPDPEQMLCCLSEQTELRSLVAGEKRRCGNEKVVKLRESLCVELQHKMELASEWGASVWLSTLPIKDMGFALHKTAFRDALCLRYGWSFDNLPSHCVCGKTSSMEHLLSCPRGGFPSIRHNEIWDITADILSEVCHNVTIEPKLQPLSGEHLHYVTGNTSAEARLDISANGVWGSRFERDFFDVRVFNPYASSNRQQSLTATYHRHELDKARQYDQLVRDVEHSSFTPLIFATTGGLGKSASTFYSHLASVLGTKKETPYSITMNLLHCRLNFALLRSSILCIRGTRSSHGRPLLELPFDLQQAECHLSF